MDLEEKVKPCRPEWTKQTNTLTFLRIWYEMEALASIMMVATLSSRISFSRGVGSRLSSSILTESVSLEIRKWRTSSSSRNRPEGEERRTRNQRKNKLFNSTNTYSRLSQARRGKCLDFGKK